MTIRRDRGSQPILSALATSLRRGCKQKTPSNDWMSHRKPIIFTHDSFAHLLKGFITRSGDLPDPQAPTPRRSPRYIWFIHTTRNTWSVFRMYSVIFFPPIARQLLLLLRGWKFLFLFYTSDARSLVWTIRQRTRSTAIDSKVFQVLAMT